MDSYHSTPYFPMLGPPKDIDEVKRDSDRNRNRNRKRIVGIVSDRSLAETAGQALLLNSVA
jgi:hypothetical protein